MKCENNIERIEAVAKSEEFYYSKLRDVLERFEEYSIKVEDIDMLIESSNSKPFKFKDFLDKNKQHEEFIILIGQIVCMSDIKGYNKEKWNLYDDKRALARAGVRQSDWTKNLLLYKKSKSVSDLTESIANAIMYIKNPEKNLTQLSENHRM